MRRRIGGRRAGARLGARGATRDRPRRGGGRRGGGGYEEDFDDEDGRHGRTEPPKRNWLPIAAIGGGAALVLILVIVFLATRDEPRRSGRSKRKSTAGRTSGSRSAGTRARTGAGSGWAHNVPGSRTGGGSTAGTAGATGAGTAPETRRRAETSGRNPSGPGLFGGVLRPGGTGEIARPSSEERRPPPATSRATAPRPTPKEGGDVSDEVVRDRTKEQIERYLMGLYE